MKYLALVLTTVLFLVLPRFPALAEATLSGRVIADNQSNSSIPAYAPGQFLVRFRSKTPELGSLSDHISDFTTTDLFQLPNTVLLESQTLRKSAIREFSSTKANRFSSLSTVSPTMTNVLAELSKHPNIEVIEPNYIRTATFTPDDSSFGLQWSHTNTEAELGWDIETGSTNQTVIAVIDTGVDYTHPDLAGNMLGDCTSGCPVNTGYDFMEINMTDWPGYVQIPGEDYDTPDDDPQDWYGHGTHVAGIAAAATNNATGVAAACPDCKIMPIKAGGVIENSSGGNVTFFELDDLLDAIYYAADAGADVINMSLGGSFSSTLEETAIDYAHAAGSTIIAAAGNNGTSSSVYPAAYANVIAVAATGPDDEKPGYSSYGSFVDLSAPGGRPISGDQILSTIPTFGTLGHPSGYRSLQGTSMAAPYVAGVAGLILADDSSLTPDDVKTRLVSAVDPDTASVDIGAGRINTLKALETTPPTGTMVINSDDATTTTTSVTLDITGSDNFDNDADLQMEVSNKSDFSTSSGYVTFQNSYPWTLEVGNGSIDVHIRFRDRAENVSTVVSDSIEITQQQVYRFYSVNYKAHFFTVNETEKNKLVNSDPNWSYENVSYNAYHKNRCVNGSVGVHRFYSVNYQSHFFTISDSEKNKLINSDPNWDYEGIAFCVFTDNTPPEADLAVFRFWSNTYQSHFFTTSTTEKDKLTNSDPNWDYEGIAYYSVVAP